MHAIYTFKDDAIHIKTLQDSSLSGWGVKNTHGLIGSAEWWKNIENGTLPLEKANGKVIEISPGYFGNWPMFELLETNGEISRWPLMNDGIEVGQELLITFVVQACGPDKNGTVKCLVQIFSFEDV